MRNYKYSLIIISSLLLLLLTGCVKQNTQMTIEPDGTTEVVQTILTSKEVTSDAEEKGEDVSEWLKEQFVNDVEKEVQIKPIRLEGQAGIQLSHTFKTVEEAFHSSFYVSDAVMEGKTSSPWKIQIKENLLSKHVTIEGYVDYNEWLAGKNNLDTKEEKIIESVGDDFHLQYSIVTPVKAVDHNADKAEQREHTWIVNKGEIKEFELHYHHLKMNNVMMIIGSISVLLASMWFFRLHKKKSKSKV